MRNKVYIVNKKNIPVFRFILVAILGIALVSLIFLTNRRKNVKENLTSYFANLELQNQSLGLIDSCLKKSYEAETSFRLYVIKKDKASKAQYLSDLKDFSKLLFLLEENINNEKKSKSKEPLGSLLQYKNIKTDAFFHLNQLNDSLINNTIALNDGKNLADSYYTGKISLNQARVFIQKTDSVTIEPIQKQERGLVKRLKEAILNKEEQQRTKINAQSTTQEFTKQERKVQQELNSLLSKTINRLARMQLRLKSEELAMVLANNNLLKELSSVLKEIKQYHETQLSKDKIILEQKAQKAFYDFDKLSLITILISFFLVILLIYNVLRIYLYERSLVKSRNEAKKQINIRKDFLAHMSHEIRTPLNSIIGFSEQLEMTKLDKEQIQQLQAVRESSKMLLTIVNDILDLSKLEAGDLPLQNTLFRPHKTINGVINSLSILAEAKSLKLVSNIDFEEDKALSGDEFRLQQVLVNLINNAIKFTDEGSVTINAFIIGNYKLKVEVVDTGRGIAKENIAGIFDEFTQVINNTSTNREGGTGLGLAICKKIILAQKGTINLKSELGKGSVFSFEIPYTAVEKENISISELTKNTIELDALKSKRILVAEDDRMNIMLIKLIFTKWKVQFDIAENGLDALEFFKKNNYDIILTDINMPGLSGLKLAEEIRNNSDMKKAAIPVIAVTANVMKNDLDFYLKSGITDFLIKPYKEEVLYDVIKKHL